jgi:glycosyltransferase involved in cell wall biosynthesis
MKAPMPPVGRRITNILMTSASDAGVGGVQVVFRELVHWLEHSGRQVHLLYQAPLPRVGLVEKINPWGRRAFYCPMPAIVKESALLSVPVFLVYVPIALLHLVRLLHRKKIDVINCHFLTPYFIHLIIAARLVRVPVVVSVHGADIDSYAQLGLVERWLFRRIMRGADRIVACSGALARQTIEAFPDTRGKVSYVYNGVNLAHYVPVPHTRALPRPFLLGVCRHVRKKGVDTLLRAFAVVARDVPELSLVLVGAGPLLDEHKALARSLRLEDRVAFMGEVAHDEVSSFFAACTLFVLPSRAEPFGLVLLEAAYHGKAIVATRVGGVPEIIASGVNGVLVEPDDPGGMAAQILTLLNQPELARQLGGRARQTLATRFLWEERILDYIAIFEGRPGPSPIEPDAQRGVGAPLQPA